MPQPEHKKRPRPRKRSRPRNRPRKGPRPKPTVVMTAEDIEALRANAARPEDCPALRVHSVSQDGEPAGVPPEVVELARDAGEQAAGPGGRRRRRGRRRKKPTAETDAPPAAAPTPEARATAAGEAVTEALEMLEVPAEAYELGPRTVRLFVTDEERADYPELPPGYGFKGGVARKALARTLRLPISTAPVRDIDLLRGPDTPGDHDRALAERYMTEDLILGDAKVEAVVSRGDYFGTREVTMNQVWFLDNEVEATHLGLLDTLAGVVRVTREHLNLDFGRAHPIVAFKALRFAANIRAEGRDPTVTPFRISFRRRPHPFAFFLALQLSRAYESGPDVAAHYLDYVRRWNLLAKADLPDEATPPEAAALLTERLTDYHLDFAV
ncbi:MAG: hypothetical protein AAFX76_00890 [Planctomycetota bacterium]